MLKVMLFHLTSDMSLGYSKSPLCPFQDEKIVSTKLQIIHVIEAECNSVRLSGDDIWKANLWELQLREKKKTKKDS